MDGPPPVHDEFVRLARERLDPIAPPAGLALNSVGPAMGDSGPVTSVLYEALAAEFVAAYPGLAPEWDDVWMHEAACVDLWVHYRHADGRIEGNLEHWDFDALAAHYGDDGMVDRIRAALDGGGDLAARLDVIAEVLRLALERSRPAGDR